MTVQLLPHYTRLGLNGSPLSWFEPLAVGPNYVRTRDATRWHRPRHGNRYPDGRVLYSYWCGANSGDLGADSISPDEPLCGTCEGRFLAQQAENELVFTPMTHLPPAQCPAAREEVWVPFGHRHGTFPCPVCGEPVRARSVSRYFAGCAVSRHKPGPGLIPPCPSHGWHHIVPVNGRPACACQRENR